jgi:hypothetical protein
MIIGGRFRMTTAPFDAEQTTIEITLKRPGALAGTVVESAGRKPVADFRVRLAEKKGEHGTTTTRGHDGQFRIEAGLLESEGNAWLVITAEGLATTWAGPFELQDGVVTEVGEVALNPGVAIRGVLEDEKGRPVASARLAAVAPGTELDGSPVADAESAGVSAARHLNTAASAADGRFAIGGLEAGAFDLLVWHPGHPPHRHPGVSPGGPEIRIVLPEGGYIGGKIEKSAKTRFVEVVSPDGWDAQAQLAADGAYRFGPVRGGSYTVRVREKRGFMNDATVSEAHVTVAPGRDTTWNGEGAQPRLETLRGLVLLPDGKPATGWHVALLREGGGLDVHLATTDAEGRFSVAEGELGTYSVHASPTLDDNEPAPSHRVEFNGVDTVTIRMPLQESSASGALGDSSGRPMAHAKLRVRLAGEKDMTETVAQSSTDATGRFEVKKLWAGGFDLYLAGDEVKADRFLRTFRVEERQALDLGTLRAP